MLATQPQIPSDSPSLVILGTLLGLAAFVGLLAALGFVQPVVQWVGWLIKDVIRRGFLVWERVLGWMPWPVFAVFVVAVLALGAWADTAGTPSLLALASAAALFAGVVSVLAYIHLDIERVAIERGYKAMSNPEQGQQLALDYLKHGHRAPWPLLAAAALSFVGGFTLLNKSLWLGPGRAWYNLDGLPGTLADFAAFSVISLYNAVDLLDVAQRQKLFQLPHVAPAAWPARALLVVYKAFFAFVVVQQLLSALRRSGQMGQVVRDFWNPNPAIHGRARTALPLFGVAVVGPLMNSLRGAAKVTREVRDELPAILAGAGPQAIPMLASHLRDPNEHVRIVSAGALGQIGGRRTLARLVRMSSDPSDAVRLAVIDAIGRIAHPRAAHLEAGGGLWSVLWSWLSPREQAMRRALAALIAGTRDRSAGVRAQALAALGDLGPAAGAALPAVRAALREEDEEAERQAVEALVRIGGAAAVPDLMLLFKDTSAAVRLAAARGLGHLGPAGIDGAEALARLVQDRDEAVSREAAQALARVGPLPIPAAAALHEGLCHEDNIIRARTARGVAELGPEGKPLAKALARLLDDDNDSVRAEAVGALGSIGEPVPEAMAGLTRALEDDDNWVTALAAEALGKIGRTAAGSAEALVAALRHPTPQVRANAAAALGNMGPAGAVAAPSLIAASKDKDAEVRQAAVRSLGQQGRPSLPVLDALRKAMADQDALVRAAAVAGLRDLGHMEEKECAALLRDGADAVQMEALASLPRLDNLSEGILEEVCLCLRTDRNPAVRIKAASVLGQVGAGSAAVCAALAEAARTAEEPVRVEAVRSLSELDCASGPAAFEEGLKDASAEVRRAAVLGWARGGDKGDAPPASLVAALQDADAVVRSTAAFALGRRRSLPEDAIAPLVASMADPEDRVRFHATVALRKSEDAAAREAVRKRLGDESARVRLAAARALLGKDGADAEARKVADEALASGDEAVQRLAKQILGAQAASGSTPG